MSEKRLIDGALSDAERSVLESIQLDKPSRESASRAAAALGLAPASAWALGGSGWLASLAVVGVGCLTWVAVSGSEATSPPRESSALVAPAALPVVAPPRVEERSVAPSNAEASVVAAVVPSEKHSTPVAQVAAPPSAVKVAPKAERSSSSLAEQIALLDRARAALARGRVADALRDVSAYQSRFGAGAFAQEAAVLRVQALARAGRKDEAHDEASAFARKYPKSPHASQVSRY